ncbi:MAG: DUF3299 domain-containing protein [Sulfuritalea sp.]|nr:DUF3299 domain-containing protein [Sulfuritalea sp.]
MRRLLLLLALCLAPPLHAADDYREIKWEALVPKDWDPAKEFKALDLDKLQDSDPRAMEVLEKMRALWDAAPTVPTLAGAKLKLPGFAIPLENKGGKVSEFLLVPYFGACIHSPPPPANQIIHVVAKRPVSKLNSMDTVWVSGTMSLQYANTPWGSAGYRLTADRIVPYEEPKRK